MGIPKIRTIVFWGLYWSPLILGNYHMGVSQNNPYLEGQWASASGLVLGITGAIAWFIGALGRSIRLP